MKDDLGGRLSKIRDIAGKYNGLPPAKRREALLDYLFEIGDFLAETTGSELVSSPLHELIPAIADPNARLSFVERRGGKESSPSLLARVSVAIDVLIECGEQPCDAVQIVARQMVRSGIELPSGGTDVRGWKRLLDWRERVRTLKQPTAGFDSYRAFSDEITRMPRDQMIAAALSGDLWDLRRAA